LPACLKWILGYAFGPSLPAERPVKRGELETVHLQCLTKNLTYTGSTSASTRPLNCPLCAQARGVRFAGSSKMSSRPRAQNTRSRFASPTWCRMPRRSICSTARITVL